MADLPRFRVEEQSLFFNVVIDFAGPLYIRGENGGKSGKVYVALFACCTTRAIHLELVPDLSAGTLFCVYDVL